MHITHTCKKSHLKQVGGLSVEMNYTQKNRHRTPTGSKDKSPSVNRHSTPGTDKQA